MSAETRTIRRILAINAFDGGSHRWFLTGLATASRHAWTVIPGKPVHWKWRMRSSALQMAESTRKHIAKHGHPDLLFCTDMLDLPSFRGLLNDSTFASIPVLNYFHESQWTYPTAATGRQADHHFGYTNLLSAIAANACVFNSRFHQDTFLEASESFVRRMPDSKSVHDWSALKAKCHVIMPGIEFRNEKSSSRSPDFDKEHLRIPVIGWVSRWENDKRPDQFLRLLEMLRERDRPFRLVLLGARPTDRNGASNANLVKIQQCCADQILHDGFAVSADAYWRWLGEIDYVVSTADHEFFGIAIAEAMHAGAIPIVPDRLSYQELVPDACRYKSLDQAAEMLCRELEGWQATRVACQAQSKKLDRRITTQAIDDLIDRLVC